MTAFDLLEDFQEDFLAFLYATEGDRKKNSGALCDRCGAALEVDPESGEEHCPGCDEEE